MIATVTNLTADDLEIPFPFNRTLGPNGGGSDSVALGVNMADLNARAETGNPPWKVLNDMVKKGQITVVFADDAQTTDTYDGARNA